MKLGVPSTFRLSIHIILSLTFALLTTSTCFRPDGKEAIDLVPCGDGNATCCLEVEACMSEKYSSYIGNDTYPFYQGGCTSKDWSTAECRAHCLHKSVPSPILQCEDEPTWFVCSADAPSNFDSDSCQAGHPVFELDDVPTSIIGKAMAEPGEAKEITTETMTPHATSTTKNGSRSSSRSSSPTTSTSTTVTKPTSTFMKSSPTSSPRTSPTSNIIISSVGPPLATSELPSTTATTISEPTPPTTTSSQAPAPAPAPAPKTNNPTPIAVGSSVAGLALVGAAVAIFLFLRKRRHDSPARAESPPGDLPPGYGQSEIPTLPWGLPRQQQDRRQQQRQQGASDQGSYGMRTVTASPAPFFGHSPSFAARQKAGADTEVKEIGTGVSARHEAPAAVAAAAGIKTDGTQAQRGTQHQMLRHQPYSFERAAAAEPAWPLGGQSHQRRQHERQPSLAASEPVHTHTYRGINTTSPPPPSGQSNPGPAPAPAVMPQPSGPDTLYPDPYLYPYPSTGSQPQGAPFLDLHWPLSPEQTPTPPPQSLPAYEAQQQQPPAPPQPSWRAYASLTQPDLALAAAAAPQQRQQRQMRQPSYRAYRPAEEELFLSDAVTRVGHDGPGRVQSPELNRGDCDASQEQKSVCGQDHAQPGQAGQAYKQQQQQKEAGDHEPAELPAWEGR